MHRMVDSFRSWRHSRAGSDASSLNAPERRARRGSRSRSPSPNPSMSYERQQGLARPELAVSPLPPQPQVQSQWQPQMQPQPQLQPRTQPQPQPRIVQPQQQPQSQARYQPQHQLQPDADVEMADPVSSPPRASHQSKSSLSVPIIVTPTPQHYGSNFSNNSTRSRSRSPSNLAPPENEARASMALSTQCALSLATVAAELAPIPCIGVLVGCLTVVFQAVEKSRVNKEQWKLLQGRCVMVSRIAGAQVTNYGGEHYSGLQHASEILHE
ncbi:hypothetical protein FRC12_009228 [Ceratobasidium sp. 428]|nr:hypothetical protein FRC12_009228 [Ceratobasidium sp. 428]